MYDTRAYSRLGYVLMWSWLPTAFSSILGAVVCRESRGVSLILYFYRAKLTVEIHRSDA